MSDITKCPGTDCPVRDRCYRFAAIPNSFRQSYFTETPGYYSTENPLGGVLEIPAWKCDMYWGEQQNSILEALNNIVTGNHEI